MWDDPIVQEIRNVREEHATKLGFNIKAIVDDLKKQQESSRMTFVSLPPKKPTIYTKLKMKKGVK